MWVKSKDGNLINLDAIGHVNIDRCPTRRWRVVATYKHWEKYIELWHDAGTRQNAEQYRDEIWETICTN